MLFLLSQRRAASSFEHQTPSGSGSGLRAGLKQPSKQPKMISSLSGKVVLLTGAASGIGKATAIKLSALGCALALTDVVDSSIAATAESCHSDEIIILELDVSNTAQCELVVKQTVARFGRLDHVFNGAELITHPKPSLNLSEGSFDRLVAVNFKGTFNMTKAALPHLKEHAGCSFVNVSSILGQRPNKEMAVYCATKYAVIGFSKSMALELGPRGIRVNIVAPGFVNTPTNASVPARIDAIKTIAEHVGLRRSGKPEEIADVVAFLMSDQAKYMNGSLVEINGGLPV